MNFDFVLPSPGVIRRWSMKPLPDGHIEEQSTTSTDGGKTWKAQYTLYWVPAK